MSYETVLSPKFSTNGTIILAKEQFHNLYTFLAMPILIFSLVYLFMRHHVCVIKSIIFLPGLVRILGWNTLQKLVVAKLTL